MSHLSGDRPSSPIARVTVPTSRAGLSQGRWAMSAVYGNPSSGRIDRAGGPVGSTAYRNGYSRAPLLPPQSPCAQRPSGSAPTHTRRYLRTPLHPSCYSPPSQPRLVTTSRPASLLHQRPGRSHPRRPIRRVVGPIVTRHARCITGAPQSTTGVRLGQPTSDGDVPPALRPPRQG